MREAKYAAAQASGPKAAASRPKAMASPSVAPGKPEAEGLCGHRSMNGRTCTREHGHAAKNHRYS